LKFLHEKQAFPSKFSNFCEGYEDAKILDDFLHYSRYYSVDCRFSKRILFFLLHIKRLPMPRGEMLMVFTYDVSKDRKRRRVARILEDAATRVQYSVFESRMTRQRAAAVAQRCAAELEAGDSLRVYAIGANGERRTRVYGDATPVEPAGDYWLL
jgi:CRISPR-associated protein Cas2